LKPADAIIATFAADEYPVQRIASRVCARPATSDNLSGLLEARLKTITAGDYPAV
jgi:hypothetical protein